MIYDDVQIIGWLSPFKKYSGVRVIEETPVLRSFVKIIAWGTNLTWFIKM